MVRGIIESTGNPTVDNAVVIGCSQVTICFNVQVNMIRYLLPASSTDYVDAVEEEIRTLYGNDIGITTYKISLKLLRNLQEELMRSLQVLLLFRWWWEQSV